jgi:choline dehydrogenase-like flavoprotein
MLNSADQLSEFKDISSKVVIAGGGLAGLTLAKKLSKHADVIVLERGGSQSSSIEDECREAYTSGIDYPFTTTRDFRLGGSTSIWAGFCAEFDAFDFSKRSWIPLSGWPFPAEELAVYKKEVGEILNLAEPEFNPTSVVENAQIPLPINIKDLDVTAWRFGNPTLRILDDWSFGEEDFQNIKIITNARVVDIHLTRDHSAVDHYLCRTRGGNEFRIKADFYIIAMGGLETARLLLASNSQCRDGVANSSNMVGRCFSEHPHLSLDGFKFNPRHPLVSWAEKGSDEIGNPFALCLGLSESQQIELKILNHRAHIFRTREMSPSDIPKLGLFIEQSPNLDSRITLKNTLDDWGVPKLNLHWCLSDLEFHSYVQAANYISEYLQRAGAGQIVSRQNPTHIRNCQFLHSNHQLGTTRMSTDPRLGPIDSNCRSHDHENLYVAGGSVFPTVSWANPTFTMLLVTLRLAEYLKQNL